MTPGMKEDLKAVLFGEGGIVLVIVTVVLVAMMFVKACSF